MRLHFDACCLHRPLDDQRQERVRLETEAVCLLLDRCALGIDRWVCSDAIVEEVSRNPDDDRRLVVQAMLRFADEQLSVDSEMWDLAGSYARQSLTAMDALHLAVAEVARCDALLTTDDRFLRRVFRLQPSPRIRVVNPAAWLLENVEHGA